MESIKYLSNGGFIVTYRCTAACGHCLYASSPNREADYVDADTTRHIMRHLKQMGCDSLHIGGGEPFLSVDGLCAVIRTMNDEGVGLDYLETNAYWATSPSRALALLTQAMEAGLTTIMFSLCPYHTAYVPLDRVKNAISAAQTLGIPYFVWQQQFAREVSALGDTGRTHSLEAYERTFPGGVDKLPGRFGLRMLGRAAITHHKIAQMSHEKILDNDKPCRAMLKTSHFHVDFQGRFIPPGCTGFAIPLDEIDNIGGRLHPAIDMMLAGGVKALFEYAVATGFMPDDAYIDKCGLCQHIRAYLALNTDRFRDLAPVGFYSELYPT